MQSRHPLYHIPKITLPMNQAFYRGMTPQGLDLPKDRLMETGTAVSKIGTLAHSAVSQSWLVSYEKL